MLAAHHHDAVAVGGDDRCRGGLGGEGEGERGRGEC